MRYKRINYEHLLTKVLKPGRYIGCELNSINKKVDSEKICFCLAFPEVYEVGLAHLGLKILGYLLNESANAVADRAYCPWLDFGQLLIDNKLPLFSLENKVSLADFDVIGFTLQSEVTYTNILYMLDLSGIPLLSTERCKSDPIILAGGPCSSNPRPLDDFIDVFLIGDGEEAIIEIKDSLYANRHLTRPERIKALVDIQGIYVPGVSGQVKIRKFQGFSESSKPYEGQLIPWMQSTHDRHTSELMRGCSRGCRFCQAGFFYRPVRERNPEIILNELAQEVAKNGWEDTALTSLSSSDYTCIRPLLLSLHQRLKANKAKLSLPSLRVDSLDNELVSLMNALGRGGLTIAPEAGSQRLRDIINKNISEAEIMEGINIALANGWQSVKLYFMIGLPFEEAADVEAIVKLVEKIISLAGKRLRINITLSPFIPKPFTPFQYAPMQDFEYLLSTARYVKDKLKRYKFVKASYHTIESSLVECFLSRGDTMAGKVIYNAYINGAKFDGWSEFFNYDYWLAGATVANVDMAGYRKGSAVETVFPWDIVDLGISREYLQREWQKAKDIELTPSCRDNCTACGICNPLIKPVYFDNFTAQIMPEQEEVLQKIQPTLYRVYYAKTNELCYVGHLDMLRMIHRLVRMADIGIMYSEGFSPHPKISLSAPVSLGISSALDFFDIQLASPIGIDNIIASLKLPPNMDMKKVEKIIDKNMKSHEYYLIEEVSVRFTADYLANFTTQLAKFNEANSWEITKLKKGKEKKFDLKEIIHCIKIVDHKIHIIKNLRGANIYDILLAVFGLERSQAGSLAITRERLMHKVTD